MTQNEVDAMLSLMDQFVSHLDNEIAKTGDFDKKSPHYWSLVDKRAAFVAAFNSIL